MSISNDLAVLWRVIGIDRNGMSAEMAREVLKWEVPPEERDRLHELAVKEEHGKLTPEERLTLDSYHRVQRFLELWRAKAQVVLKKAT